MIFSTTDGFAAVGGARCILLDGCFDPVHSGHVRYIRAAALAFPDHQIVVGVAPDAVIRHKGREPLFSQRARCQTVDGVQGVRVVIAQDRPTHEMIAALKPGAFVKGKEWEGKLSPDILTACALYGVQVVYLDTARDSSSDALRRWALRDAERGLDRLEPFIAAQASAPAAAFDADYFQGHWRAGGNVYDYETRKAIEGPHPQLIKDCFPHLSILDVGCGPGYLVRLLREHGVIASGIDTSAAAVGLALDRSCVVLPVGNVPHDFVDVTICREVLEHVPVQEIPAMICDLFRVARRFVYITTRFSDKGVFDAETDFETDPTHISLLSQPFLRSLCVLNGGKRRRDLEGRLDHMHKGRCLVYEL